MPSTLTYPGVYIEELPSGVHTIVGVTTSITAFIGTAPRGPVNQATTIGGFADYERTFGGLDKKSPMGFAVRDFFLNGGSQAVIVRLYHSPDTTKDTIIGVSSFLLKKELTPITPVTPITPDRRSPSFHLWLWTSSFSTPILWPDESSVQCPLPVRVGRGQG